MRIAWICPFLFALAACSAPTPPSATNSTSAGASSAASAQAPQALQVPQVSTRGADDAWQLSQQTSPMDGEIIQAARIYEFSDMDTTVQVEFACTVEKKQLQIKLTSEVGTKDSLSDASLFQRDLTYVKGRIKYANLPPDELFSSFRLSDNFGNEITNVLHMINNNGFMEGDGVFENYLALQGLSTRQINDVMNKNFRFNPTAALMNLFPIAIEAVNGRGTFDLVISKSEPIRIVLDRCGGNEPVMDPMLSQLLGTGATGEASAAVSQKTEGAAESSGDASASASVVVDSGSSLQPPSKSVSSVSSANTPASAQTPDSAVEPPAVGVTAQSTANAGNSQSLLPASFDCTKASSPAERAICSNASLSDLDGKVALAYKQLLGRDPLALPAQREWLKQRNQCGGDVGCLTSSYQTRLQKIKEVMSTIDR